MKVYLISGCLILLVSGCASTQERLLDSGISQVQIRSIQSRVFYTDDRDQCLRAVIATLQDHDFLIDTADHTLGVVSATKLDRHETRATVTVRSRGEKQLMVRGSLQYQNDPVHDPEPYQRFFASLEKALFLIAHEVD